MPAPPRSRMSFRTCANTKAKPGGWWSGSRCCSRHRCCSGTRSPKSPTLSSPRAWRAAGRGSSANCRRTSTPRASPAAPCPRLRRRTDGAARFVPATTILLPLTTSLSLRGAKRRSYPDPCASEPDCFAVARNEAANGALLAPGRHDGRALEHRPFVVAGGGHGEAAILAALPGGAEALLRELPGAFAAVAGTDRLTLHLAVGGERHLEFETGGRRRRKGLAVEGGALDIRGGELGRSGRFCGGRLCRRRGRGRCRRRGCKDGYGQQHTRGRHRQNR